MSENDLTLDELLEKVVQLKNFEATALARKVYRAWQEGVTPSRSEIDKLAKYLRVDGPCRRLGEDGLCQGWLRKNADSLGFPVYPPYACPFVKTEEKPAQWRECGGYREE